MPLPWKHQIPATKIHCTKLFTEFFFLIKLQNPVAFGWILKFYQHSKSTRHSPASFLIELMSLMLNWPKVPLKTLQFREIPIVGRKSNFKMFFLFYNVLPWTVVHYICLPRVTISDCVILRSVLLLPVYWFIFHYHFYSLQLFAK